MCVLKGVKCCARKGNSTDLVQLHTPRQKSKGVRDVCLKIPATDHVVVSQLI